ncbi:MAG: NAD(P)/FAD-dependent oxidoreductase, partial [Gemmatimonadales bacterium]|nr:NAD(P)/FAD-dependent oxidoreductase [Gemmatimonadales bacterium]
MSAPFDAIVIGGGVNGLVAAATLGKAGRRVLLLERGGEPGGQCRTPEFAPGFRADPLSRDAGWVPPPIVRELGLTGLELVTPDPTVSVPLGGGEWLSLSPDVGRAAETIRRHSPRDAAAWGPFTAT